MADDDNPKQDDAAPQQDQDIDAQIDDADESGEETEPALDLPDFPKQEAPVAKSPQGRRLTTGFSIGLLVGLIFLLLFVAVGYSLRVSILMGAIAAFSMGVIVSWWQSKQELLPEDPNPILEVFENETPEKPKLLGKRYIRPPKTKLKQERKSLREQMKALIGMGEDDGTTEEKEDGKSPD